MGEECEVCKVGVLLGITKYVCEQQGQENQKTCSVLYDKTVMGEMKISDFVKKVKEITKDPLDLKTLSGVEEVLGDYGFKE